MNNVYIIYYFNKSSTGCLFKLGFAPFKVAQPLQGKKLQEKGGKFQNQKYPDE